MTMGTELPTLIALGLCLLFSFLLSGMEAGVFALNRLRIRRLARSGNAQATLLHAFLEKPEKFLWTILVGNTLFNFVVLGWVAAQLYFGLNKQPWAAAAAFLVIVFLFYSFFDLLPKMLYRTYPNRLCLATANIMRLMHLVLAPLVFVAEGVSRLALLWSSTRVFTGRMFGNREEMRAVMAEAAQALTGEEHAMVNRVLDLQHFTVSRVTVPLDKTLAADAHTPVRDVLLVAREKNLSRLPVWENRDGRRRVAGLLDVTGLLYLDHLDENKTAAEFMSPALFLAEDMRLEIALRRLQRAGQRLAVVLTRDGREAGVVSMEDILKLMFGEVKL